MMMIPVVLLVERVVISPPKQAPDALLKSQTILRLGDPIGAMTFFVIRERTRKNVPPTSIEKKAVRVACKVGETEDDSLKAVRHEKT